MPYIHGDEYYICDTCGRKLDINVFSSAPLSDLKREGWRCDVETITNIVPSKLIYSQYTGGRWIREHKKTRNVMRITCNHCIIIEDRVNKIRKINEKLHG
jgi:DNA-directed RNA polymerase subunit RPC12/RpoP